MKKILLFTLLLYCSFINAQISFEKGYFISNDGQRTECFIKNLDWKNSPKDFKYKTDPSEKEFKTENIANIQEFGITNEATFKRFKIKIDRSSNELKKMLTHKEPIWSEEVIFLKVLVKGDATLYSFSDESINRYFYETKTIPTEQLINVKYIQSDNNEGAEKVIESNEYKTQLFKNVNSSNVTEKDIVNLQYKKNDLISYFIKYNNISPSSNENGAKKTNKGKFFVKITPGISIVSSTVSNDANSQLNAEIDNKTIFKFGAEAEYILPYNKNKWSLFINPTYQKYDNEKNYSVPSGFTAFPDIEYNLKITYNAVQLPVGVRHYMFLNKKSKIFINAAYTFDIVSNVDIVYTTKTGSNGTTNFNGKSGSNLAFGLGYNFKNKFSAEIRLNTKKELVNYAYTYYSAKYNAIDFILGYTIF